MAILKKWSTFTNRANLSDNDNAQVMILDTSVEPSSNQNQRTPVTQILRSGKDLSDLNSASTARTNLGLGSAAVLNASQTNVVSNVVQRDAEGNIAVEGITADALNSAGVVHTNELGEFSTSLIVNADIASNANIDLSKINTDTLGSGWVSITNNGGANALSNPCPTAILIGGTGGGQVLFPQMDLPNSLSASKNTQIFVKAAPGLGSPVAVTDIASNILFILDPGEVYVGFVTSNATPEGLFNFSAMQKAIAVNSPLTFNKSTNMISMQEASGSQAGYLSSADWNTFNNKQPAGSYLTAPVANGSLAAMPGQTIKGNDGGGPGTPQDLSVFEVLDMLSLDIPNGNIPYGMGAAGLTSSSLFTFDGTNLGIGTATPHARLQIGNSIANRKIVIWEQVNNDHEFIGMGVNSLQYRFQIEQSTSRFAFFAGTSSTTSDELFSINGNKIVSTVAGGGMQFGNSTAGYTPTTLNYNEEGTFTVNFTGAATISSVTVTFKRLGNEVRLFFQSSTVAATAASSFTTGAGAIPARLRPGASFNCDDICWVMDNSAWQTLPGRAVALNDGSIQIYKTNPNGTFTNSGNCGFGNVYLRYFVA